VLYHHCCCCFSFSEVVLYSWRPAFKWGPSHYLPSALIEGDSHISLKLLFSGQSFPLHMRVTDVPLGNRNMHQSAAYPCRAVRICTEVMKRSLVG
jgi:hypothetical protein